MSGMSFAQAGAGDIVDATQPSRGIGQEPLTGDALRTREPLLGTTLLRTDLIYAYPMPFNESLHLV